MISLPLFIYGTLRHPQIRSAVLQRDTGADDVLEAAELANYGVYQVVGASYPQLVAEQGALAVGACWYGLTADDFSILDRFEGANYHRVPVNVRVRGRNLTTDQMIAAQMYHCDIGLPIGDIWSFEAWCKTGLASFLSNDFNHGGVRAPTILPK